MESHLLALSQERMYMTHNNHMVNRQPTTGWTRIYDSLTRRLFYLEETVYELERNSDDSMWRRVVNQRSTNLSGRRNAWIPPKYLIFDPNRERVKF